MYHELQLNFVNFFIISLLYLKNCNNLYLHKENYKSFKFSLLGKDIVIIFSIQSLNYIFYTITQIILIILKKTNKFRKSISNSRNKI